MAETVITPYSSAVPFMVKPGWLNEYDAQRLGAYGLYDDLVTNTPNTLALLLRGSDDKPIYAPTAKTICNTMARYVARDWELSFLPVDPEAKISEDDVLVTASMYNVLFKRERFNAVFAASKKEGLRRGDWAFYIYADPEKPEGARISIKAIDPRIYFPITDETDVDKVVGCDLIEQIATDDGIIIKRQRFLKNTSTLHPSYQNYEAPVVRITEFLELNNWETEPKKTAPPENEVAEEVTLDGIMNLPVYHIKNNEQSGNPFGTSDLAGIESVLAGINQAVTDQDLALSMAGLGMYATDSGAPIDEESGETVDWQLGPGRVVEVGEGKKFLRVTGVASVTPSLDHIHHLRSVIFETLGINDVALGVVDTTVAESGIALRLRMGPLLDAAAEKDLAIKAVMDQMLWDLKDWFQVYEGTTLNAVPEMIMGEKIPADRKAKREELHQLFTDGVIPLEYYVTVLNADFGYEIPLDALSGMEQPEEGNKRLEEEAGTSE